MLRLISLNGLFAYLLNRLFASKKLSFLTNNIYKCKFVAKKSCANYNISGNLVIQILNEEEKMSTLEKVKKVVVDQLSVDESLVTPEASFTADLGADSLDTVELVMAFEEEFGCEIPDEEAEKIQTVQDAVNYIDSHK